jgi:hypothetical protein
MCPPRPVTDIVNDAGTACVRHALRKRASWDKRISPAPWTALPGPAQKTGRTLGLHLIVFERAESISECAVQLGT